MGRQIANAEKLKKARRIFPLPAKIVLPTAPKEVQLQKAPTPLLLNFPKRQRNNN